MATSGNIDKALATWITLRIHWEETAQSIANNTTTLKVSVQLITGGGNLDTSNRTISLTVNGTTYTGTNTLTIAKHSTKTLFTKEGIIIPHNSNGSKSVAMSCSVPFNASISGTTWGTKSASGTAILTTIYKNPSTVSRTGTARMGQKQTIKITRANSSFTHKLYYTWAGTKTLIASNVGTSYEWTPPVSLANKIPNATSGTCVLTCETYSGSTLVGSKTLSFTLSIPADAAPSIKQFVLSDKDRHDLDFGVFINNKSIITFSVWGEGDGYGSTLKSYSVSIAGQTITGTFGTLSQILGETDVINLSDATPAGKTYTATATITDSRGRTASKTATFTVVEYLPPQFTMLSAERCLENGTLDDNGECLSFSVAVNISPLNNKNTATYKLEYKLTTASEYSPLTFDGSGYSYSGTAVYKTPTFSTERSYNIRLSVTDYFGTVYKNLKLSTAKPILDILFDGSGIAFNKVAEKSGLCDIGFTTRFYEGVENIIAEKQNDLNDLLIPNTYVSVSNGAETYANTPEGLTGTFTIEVLSAGAEGQLMQRLTQTYWDNPRIWVRHYYKNNGVKTWGEWVLVYSADRVNDFGIGKVTTNTAEAWIKTADVDTIVFGADITIPAGTYVLIGKAIFSTGSTSGTRNNQVLIAARAVGAASSTTTRVARQRVFAAGANYAELCISDVYTATTETILAVAKSSSIAEQAAGNTAITAVRIA